MRELEPANLELAEAFAMCAEGVRDALRLAAAFHDMPDGFSFVLAIVHDGQPIGAERAHLLGGGRGSDQAAMTALLRIVGRQIGAALEIFDRGDAPVN